MLQFTIPTGTSGAGSQGESKSLVHPISGIKGNHLGLAR